MRGISHNKATRYRLKFNMFFGGVSSYSSYFLHVFLYIAWQRLKLTRQLTKGSKKVGRNSAMQVFKGVGQGSQWIQINSIVKSCHISSKILQKTFELKRIFHLGLILGDIRIANYSSISFPFYCEDACATKSSPLRILFIIQNCVGISWEGCCSTETPKDPTKFKNGKVAIPWITDICFQMTLELVGIDLQMSVQNI